MLEETQSKNETVSVMKEEIDNYKNVKQIQTNSMKQKKKPRRNGCTKQNNIRI